MPHQQAHPYEALTPDVILDAVESTGLRCDGRLLALNSFENRVYQVGIEESTPVVVKFYRPWRWTSEQILEEHAFAQDLLQAEIPVVAPRVHAGATLREHAGFRFAVYPRQRGRAPDLETEETLTWMGRFLGRIHAVGATRAFVHRRALDVATLGDEPSTFVLERGFVPSDLAPAYRTPGGAVAREDPIRLPARFPAAAPAWRLPSRQHPVG